MTTKEMMRCVSVGATRTSSHSQPSHDDQRRMELPPKHKLLPKRQHSRYPGHSCTTTGELHPAAPLPSPSDPQSRIHSLQPLQLLLSFPPNSVSIPRNEIPEDQRGTMTHSGPSLPSQPKHFPLPTPSSLAHPKQLSSSTNRTHSSTQSPLLQLSPSGTYFPVIFLNIFGILSNQSQSSLVSSQPPLLHFQTTLHQTSKMRVSIGLSRSPK